MTHDGGAISFDEVLYDAGSGIYQNDYRVVVDNEHPWDLPQDINLETTYYCLINSNGSDPFKNPIEFSVDNANDSVSVVIDNRYEESQLTIVKTDNSTGALLSDAKFSVYKIVNGQSWGGIVKTYTTDENGELVIRGGEPFESETLYGIKESEAPEGYLLPQQDEWHYFYFCNDDYLEPSILANLPEDATAVNLTNSGDRITINNQKELIDIPVMKIWQGSTWPASVDNVVIGLYQSIDGGDITPVRQAGVHRTVTLRKAAPYNNTTFKDLPSRDDQGRNITYSIIEESIDGKKPLEAGYVQEYGVSSAGVYVVRNKPANSLTVSKEWYDFNGEKVTDTDSLESQSSVTFDVYRSSRKFVDNDPSDGITNADMTAFVSDLVKVRENLSFGHPNWSKAINNLDKQDDLGNPYYYYVLETVPSFGDEIYVVDEENGTVLIKNKIAPETVNLKVTKAALKDDPREESLNRDFEFTLKLQKDETHPIRSWQVYTDDDHPENNLVTDWEGKVKFTLKPTDPDNQPTSGASITLNLPKGVTASVTETYNPEYTVKTNSTLEGETGDDGRTFSYDTSGGYNDLTYTNTLHVVCKVVKSDELLPPEERQIPFESLESALNYIRDNPSDFTSPWTIYMLEDYTIPASDQISIGAEENLTLTTASRSDQLFPFDPKDGTDRDAAVITRGETGGSMLSNAGSLTLEKICLDGGNGDNSITATGDGGLVSSTGTLNLNADTTLRNSTASGKGGAVYAAGTVNIVDGVSISGNRASLASALYLSGTLNMTGGSITGNTVTGEGGAVVTQNVSDKINLSQSPVIFDNVNEQGKAANLYIGVDSDNVVNVVSPGLNESAHIGITAMQGHRLIGEQFAIADYDQTANLNSFTNDIFGYRGKLKDGTSTNIVWEGLTMNIKKIASSEGTNPRDRFTIYLESSSITMNSYVIDGTLDYIVEPARQNRPGRITFRDVKIGDVYTISSMPVGSYTIKEAASNYSPSYTMQFEGDEDEDGDVIEIVDGGATFSAQEDCTVTVTNARRTADVRLTKTLADRLKGATETQDFSFTAKLTEADGTSAEGFTIFEDEADPSKNVTTDENGEATFNMSPPNEKTEINPQGVSKNLKAPVGATMTITEADDPNYRITTNATTMPSEGEAVAIEDQDTSANVFAFDVTDDNANVTFANERKMAEIELCKNLTNKVSKTESFKFNVSLTRADGTKAAYYNINRDNEHPILTNEEGVASITLEINENESTKAITLKIPDGTKLEVEEDLNGHNDFYTTKYSINGGSEKNGTTATINKVSDSDHSIVFNNTRKTNTITVKNTVNGYSGNVVPFTFTATVTDGGEKDYDDYDAYGFTNGVMTFELTKDQTQTLTVPYGATLNITEAFIVGYETTIKHGNTDLGTTRTDEFQVASNQTVTFTNNQLIGLRLVNNTSSTLENVQVYVGYGTRMYRVNNAGDDQELVPQTSGRWATLDRIEAGKTAQLEIMHKTGVTDEQDYTVKGTTPAIGYYYTINNEPSFHETANPAILRVYDASEYEVKGKLRYSVQDSTVTFTEQPLVSFNANDGVWTTEMEGYRDKYGDKKVYQKPVNSGEAVERPDPDPVYPAQGVQFVGWTEDEGFAQTGHTKDEAEEEEKLYDFSTPVNRPLNLYAIWNKGETHIVTVKNAVNGQLTINVELKDSEGEPASEQHLAENIETDADGLNSFTLEKNESKNLSIRDKYELVLSAPEADCFAYSADYNDGDNNNTDNSFTINSVDNSGTVSFICGICKITDVDGKILYDNNGNPAVYMTLSEAFTAYNGTLYTNADHSTEAGQAAVKMLIDEFAIDKKHAFPEKDVVLTTADKNDHDFPYVGIRDRATLYRDGSYLNGTLFTNGTDAAETTLTDIILDGRELKLTNAANGGLINLNKSNASLTIGTGTTMENVFFADYMSNANGGAIYIENGTLDVKGGLFSNLHARQGGAIYAKSNALLKIEGNGIRFANCSANASDGNGNGDGGAIYYNDSVNALTLNGGEDQDNPGIVFDSCVAKGKTGSGGAIYANTSSKKSVSVSGCSFTECSAREETNTNAAYGGGAICADNVSGVIVSYCSFTDCDTLSRGGGVVVYVANGGEVSVNYSTFERCNCKGQGGGLAVYQPKQEDSNVPKETDLRAQTKLSVNNCGFSNCSSGTNNGSGGAIQCYLPRMEFKNSTFTDCWAGKEGGAVNNYFGNGYAVVWPGTYMNMSGCRFIRCRAEDRYQAEQPQHYGGGVNTKVQTTTITDSYFEDCVSTLREGGALHLGGQGSSGTGSNKVSSSATITGSTFKNCTAKTGGGAVMASTETLNVSDSYFYGCQAFGKPDNNYVYNNNNKKNQNGGGAISHSENSRASSNQNTTTITNCVFSVDPEGKTDAQSCSTATDGGAIWTRANTVTVDKCTIDGCLAGDKGGGIYLSKNGTQSATISGSIINGSAVGSIENCQAVNGSAVYVGDKATFSGVSITGNTCSVENSGAIQGTTSTPTAILYFEGDTVVRDNTYSGDGSAHNVVMPNNNNTTIYTTANGLGVNAYIGVYTTTGNAYNNHGKEGQPFGTWNPENGNSYLDSFVNDRNPELFGYQSITDADDKKIYWGSYICKITDEYGNTLKRSNGRDAVYPRISLAFGDYMNVKNYKGNDAEPKYVKMLVENYQIHQSGQIDNFPETFLTLTTEKYIGDVPVSGKYDGKHPYRGTEGTVCTISPNSGNNSSLFKLNNSGSTFTLEAITLDGRKDHSSSKGNCRLIEAVNGSLVVNEGTTFQYGYVTSNNKPGGGAIYAASGVPLTINGSYNSEGNTANIHFINCVVEGNANGGAIWAAGSLTFNYSENDYKKPGVSFTNCSAVRGGAMCFTDSNTTIRGAEFTNCQSEREGGAYLHDSTDNNYSTTITYSSFENCRNLDVNNDYAYGGAVVCNAGKLELQTCRFRNCTSYLGGGAVCHGSGTDANGAKTNRKETTIKDTIFEGCKTISTNKSTIQYGGSYGGTIYTQAVTVSMTGCSVKDSTATNSGGALYCQSNNSNATTTISGTTFDNCSTSHANGCGGAVYSRGKILTVQDGTDGKRSEISNCTAPDMRESQYGKSGAIYMEGTGRTLNINGRTLISSNCAYKGGAIYLISGVTMNITGSPEFTQNGYTTQDGSIVNSDEGACIYLEEGSKINLEGSPKFSRNILPNLDRITNGSITDYVRQDIYMAGYSGNTAESIYVTGALGGDTIWVWPEQSPHRLANQQFAKIKSGVSVSDDTLSHFRNALADSVTGCTNGEYLAGVKVGNDNSNVYWDKMYTVSFNKKDNKGVAVSEAGFTMFSDPECTNAVATVDSADGENDTDAQGKLLEKGKVEFTSIRIGAYYMKETKVPTSFKENNTVYLVLVGTPYLSPNEANRYLWEGDGPLDVTGAETLVARNTTDAGKFFGIFPLDEYNKAILKANLAGNSAYIENIRNDYQAAFMKLDGDNKALPGAAFTIYTAILDDEGEPETFEDGYPKLKLWSRDGENYPEPVVSADGTSAYRDVDNNPLPKGMVYFRELPIGTYYLLETSYPERNGDGRRTFYQESDRVFKLEIKDKPKAEGGNEDPENTEGGEDKKDEVEVELSEWVKGDDPDPDSDTESKYTKLNKTELNDEEYYYINNREVVCKLTDGSDKLLYTKGHEIWEQDDKEDEPGTARLFPAIYPTLEKGFEAAKSGEFVNNNGEPETDLNALKLKALKDFTVTEPISYDSERDLTFTTAETKTVSDRYVFSTTRTSDTSRAEIKRGYSENKNSAENYNANDGALITVKDGASLTLTNIDLNGQKSLFNGRAIDVKANTAEGSDRISSLTIGRDTLIQKFKLTADADDSDSHDLKGGAVLMEDGTSLHIDGGSNRTAVFSDNEIANNRSGGDGSGADGGAISVGRDCTASITNAQFLRNKAIAAAEKKGNGGAVSLSKTREAEAETSLPITNVVFTSNTASYQGGAIRTAEKCDLTVTNSTFTGNRANSGDGGAIAVLSKLVKENDEVTEDSRSRLTVNGGSFSNNSAGNGNGGAVKIGSYGTLNLGENVTMSGNSAQKGGAVSAADGATVDVASGRILNNTASDKGGAFYIGESATAYFRDVRITGNKAASADGGAINVDTDAESTEYAKLYFSGSPYIFDNKRGKEQRNVVLSADTNDIIRIDEDGLTTAADIKSSTKIGVYVIDGNNDKLYKAHGVGGKPFGTFTELSGVSEMSDSDLDDMLAFFVNDRNTSLYGVKNEKEPGDVLIYWFSSGVPVAFKKVDSFGDDLSGASFTLYTDYECNELYEKAPGEYATAESADGEDTANQDGDILNKGTVLFEEIPGDVYYMKEQKEDDSSGAPSGYAKNDNTYIVLVGDALTRPEREKREGTIWDEDSVLGGITQAMIDAQKEQYTADREYYKLSDDDESEYAIFLIDSTTGKAVTDPDIANFGIINAPDGNKRVILRKTKSTYEPLANARFRIFRSDMSEVTEGHKSGGYYESDESGAYYIGDLPIGKYYLLETQAPGEYGSNKGKVFELDINTDGSTQKELGRSSNDGTTLNNAFNGDYPVEDLKQYIKNLRKSNNH